MRTWKTSGPWAYFAFTFGWSWLFWTGAIILGPNSVLVAVLVAIGGIGPAVAAVSLVYFNHDIKDRHDY